MLVGDWMTKDIITVQPETSMMKASKIMRENRFHRLPVVDGDGLLVGIVTDRDVKEAAPSKAMSWPKPATPAVTKAKADCEIQESLARACPPVVSYIVQE